MTAKERAEHELLVLLVGGAAGLHVPPARGSARSPVARRQWPWATSAGVRLDELTRRTSTWRGSKPSWREVGRLHDAGLAHNALRVPNVVVTAAGTSSRRTGRRGHRPPTGGRSSSTAPSCWLR